MDTHLEGQSGTLPVLVAAVTASLVLGTVGFLQTAPQMGLFTAVYRSLQLFTLESGAADPPVPWALEVARWLAPASLAGGIVTAAWGMLERRRQAWRARRRVGHCVVCGIGDKGASLGLDLLEQGFEVSAIDPAPDPEHAEAFRYRGGIWIPRSARSADALHVSAVARASHVIIATGSDQENVAIAMEVARAKAGANPGPPPLAIFVHLADPLFRNLLERNGMSLQAAGPQCRVRFFNYYANQARWIIARHPLETVADCGGAVDGGLEIHLVLPDLGDFAAAMLIESGRSCHYAHGRKVHVHLIAPQAERELRAQLHKCPGLAECLEESRAVEAETGEDFAAEVGRLAANRPTGLFTIFPASAGCDRSLARVLQVHEALDAGAKARLIVPIQLQEELAPLAAAQPLLGDRLGFFPEQRTCAGRKAVFDEDLDRRAKALHQVWLDESNRQIECAHAAGDDAKAARLAAKPSYRPWDELSDEQKDANRAQADHFAIKVRAAGCDPASVTTAQWKDLPPATLEVLARMEHQRWMAHSRIMGWRFGSTRDDTAKIHPNLVPYDELDEPTKAYDREAVRNLVA